MPKWEKSRGTRPIERRATPDQQERQIAQTVPAKPADITERPEWGSVAWQDLLLDALSRAFEISKNQIAESESTRKNKAGPSDTTRKVASARRAGAIIAKRSMPHEKGANAFSPLMKQMFAVGGNHVPDLVSEGNLRFGADENFTRKARQVANEMGVLLRS